MQVIRKNKFNIFLGIIITTIFLISSISTFALAFELKNKVVNDYSYNITRSDNFGVDFSIFVEDFESFTIEANDEIYDKIRLKNCGFTSDYGKAALPTISFYVAVPQDAEVKLNYETFGFDVIKDYYIIPSQPPKPDTDGYIDPTFTKNDSFYIKNEYYPSSVVEISPIKIIRGCQVVLVSVFPFSYNPLRKEIRFYSEISINIDFIGGTCEFIPRRLQSVYFQPLFDAYIINSNILERASINNPKDPISGLLQNEQDRADLLIVVYDDFYEEILPLAEWRHKTGIETKVVKWSSIGSTSEELRSYMQNAYENWELPPSFLLIVGDADHIPVNYLYPHPYPYGGQGNTGTDLWYVAFPSDDYLPDIHGGRISVDNEDELTIVVNKILGYCKNPYMEDNWFDDVLLAAKEEGGRFFVWSSETIFDYLDPLGYNCNRQYQYGNPPGTTEGVIEAINNGVIIVNHRDHGSSLNDPDMGSTGWSAPPFTTDHILDDIDNGEMYPVMFSLNCESGWFDGETDINGGNYESIGEVGLRVSNRGFVSVIAATRVSYSGYNDELCRGFYDGMFPGFDADYPNGDSYNPFDTSVFMMGQVMNYGKFWMYDKYVVPGGCSPYPWSPSEEATRVEFEMFHVHGDPTMEVWTEYPQSLTVDHPEEILLGQNNIEISISDNKGPVENALVCLIQGYDIYLKGLTDPSGNVEFEITTESDNEINLVVTSHNHLYYEGKIEILSKPVIDIKTIRGGFFKATATIKNEGGLEATNVQWSISLNGGFILVGKNTNGIIPSILPHEEVEISSNDIIGFGKTVFNVFAEIPESSDSHEKEGTIFLFYINIKPSSD